MGNEIKTTAESFTPMDISDADFRRLTVFIRQQYGIDLSHKRQLISGRLSHSIKTLG